MVDTIGCCAVVARCGLKCVAVVLVMHFTILYMHSIRTEGYPLSIGSSSSSDSLIDPCVKQDVVYHAISNVPLTRSVVCFTPP